MMNEVGTSREAASGGDAAQRKAAAGEATAQRKAAVAEAGNGTEAASDGDAVLYRREEPGLVIVTGMSGAGRTEAMHALEDLGYYCIDNLPASLLRQLLELDSLPGQPAADHKIAVVCDARSRDFFTGFSQELKKLDERQINYRLLFLDADDAKLVSRYKSSRRRHPLCEEGMTIGQGIQKERSLL
ncbi:MAG: hypothetical protein LBB46_01345, partial [Coriobacteriaceae bacterium]|nr:hypothetical protein [Coriobacteriaceae bacterium]